ncbi:MAG: hypothetical protein ACRDI1_11785 [Actinomycetota bacterium]
MNLATLSGYGEPFYHMFEYLPDALREYSPRWQQALGTTRKMFSERSTKIRPACGNSRNS